MLHISFRVQVCLVSEPLVRVVFSFANSERSVFICRLFEKCILRQLLNSVLQDVVKYQTSCLCYLPKLKVTQALALIIHD